MEWESTLARSDFKVQRKTGFLTMIGLSHAENMVRSASRRISDHHQAAGKQAVTDDAGLAVVFARVLELDGCAFETIAASAKSKPRSANVFARLPGSKVTRMGYCSYNGTRTGSRRAT
jgi:hypothetical protein